MQCFSHQSQIAVTDENPRVHEPREKQGYHETVSFCLAPGGAVIDLPARAAALIERCGDLLALDRRNRIELAGLGQHLCAETCSPTAGRASWLWQGYSNAAGLRVLLHLVPHRGGGATVVMFANLAFPPEGIRDLSARERQVLALAATGLRRDRMAHRLGISVATIDLHCANFRRKLGAKTTPEAVVKWLMSPSRPDTLETFAGPKGAVSDLRDP